MRKHASRVLESSSDGLPGAPGVNENPDVAGVLAGGAVLKEGKEGAPARSTPHESKNQVIP